MTETSAGKWAYNGDIVAGKGSAVLPCPECGTQIVRSGEYREQAVAWSCPKCEFQGP